VIASSFTSPIDAVYLAAIFDPVFTASYPNTRKVEHISLLQAVLRAFAPPLTQPKPGTRLVDVAKLVEEYPSRPIVIFPECTTTNGRAILPLNEALLAAPNNTPIFPISLRYSPADVVTPIPGSYISFLWTLLSKPTHCIRVRIAEAVALARNLPGHPPPREFLKSDYSTNYLDIMDEFAADGERVLEQGMLHHIGDSLARMGRVQRVSLGVKEKQEFVRMWSKTRSTW